MPEPTSNNMAFKIPIFGGNLRHGEIEPEETGTNVDIFFNTLDSYFSHKGITDNVTKMWILYNHISKVKGDAIDLIVMYDKEDQKYDDVKREFLIMYKYMKSTPDLANMPKE